MAHNVAHNVAHNMWHIESGTTCTWLVEYLFGKCNFPGLQGVYPYYTRSDPRWWRAGILNLVGYPPGCQLILPYYPSIRGGTGGNTQWLPINSTILSFNKTLIKLGA